MTGYMIWAPNRTNYHGGIRALHKLKEELRARGQRAYLHYEYMVPDSYMIYPEIINGNPYNAERYCHWLLNKANHDGPQWAWEAGMGDFPLLTVDIVERELWQPQNVFKSGVAWWQGKGTVDRSIIPNKAHQITQTNFRERKDLANYIGTLDYLISFDPFTALNVEAVCAGTPVLVHAPHNNWQIDEVKQHNWTPYGLAYTPDELHYARETVHLAFDHYDSMRSIFQERINAFVEATGGA